VVDGNGCVSLKKDTVYITVTKPAVVFAGRDTTVAVGQPLHLAVTDVNNIGFNQYEWIPAYGLNNAHIGTPTAILDKSITYTVIAKNAIGCQGTDNINITVFVGPEIYVPNAFSPNGDNLNDILKAITAGIRYFHYFRIYNRWGNLVFSTTDQSIGWDGTFKSAAQTSGTTFVWIAAGEDYRGNLVQRKGTVILIK
jgi:gliding motility-associated-like protein